MKKYLLILISCMLLVTACGKDEYETEALNTADIPEESINEPTEIVVDETKILNMTELTELDEVVSVEELEPPTEHTSAYKVIFTTGENKVQADFILPWDYEHAAGYYPVMIYNPQIGYDNTSIAKSFADFGIIVVRIWGRNSNSETEGQKDMGGDDLIDNEVLLGIIEKADFLAQSDIFIAGSSEGSIRALRMAQLHGESLAGCAVIDVIPDLQGMAVYRGENIINYCAALVGGTYDEIPEEYDKRSAVTFYEDINIPVYFMNYTENTSINLNDTEKLYLSMKEAGKDVQYMLFEKNFGDFIGDPAGYLVDWMKGE